MTTIHHGSCVTVMADMPEASVDAIVCDPPYELGFMGKSWDSTGVAYDPDTWRAARRVLKPGGHLLAFGGTRTWHRLAVAVEDAGFEIRDSIAWLYGSGFPKSLDVGKAIDKAARGVPQGGSDPTSPNHGKYRTTTTEGKRWDGDAGQGYGAGGSRFLADGQGSGSATVPAASGVAEAASEWQGWGTALKPAHEPIVVARKPLAGTVAANVLEHGTGALNIDGCRIGTEERTNNAGGASSLQRVSRVEAGYRKNITQSVGEASAVQGRWPANVILDETHEPVLRLRYNLPVEVERTIREFFDASTDHLPRLRDSNAGAAEPSATDAVLLPEVLRRVDEPEPDGRERDSLAAGPHPGIPKEDAGFSGGEGTARTGESSVDGRDLPQPWIRPRSRADIEPDRTGDLLLDAQRLDGSGLHTRAPSSRSEILGATLGVDGACSPHKRGEGRQPSGELGTPLERGSSEDARRGGARGLPATSGERHSPGIPLEILRREVPPLWLTHFEDTGRTVRGGQAAALDQQSGTLTSGAGNTRRRPHRTDAMAGVLNMLDREEISYGDTGGASRFFYCSKAPKAERPVVNGVAHATVKPLTLMRYLVRLVTPPGGTVLDPFAGSGTTIEAAILEGFNAVGIEQDAAYLPLIQERIRRQEEADQELDFGT